MRGARSNASGGTTPRSPALHLVDDGNGNESSSSTSRWAGCALSSWSTRRTPGSGHLDVLSERAVALRRDGRRLRACARLPRTPSQRRDRGRSTIRGRAAPRAAHALPRLHVGVYHASHGDRRDAREPGGHAPLPVHPHRRARRRVPRGRGHPLVSTPLRRTPHILTMDYLLHRAPCTLMPWTLERSCSTITREDSRRSTRR